MENEVYGAHLQPFAGIMTFMRQPASRELQGVDVAVQGVPYDSATSYRSGARFGPRKIREASLQLWGYNNVLGVQPLDVLAVVDYGDVEVVPVDIKATNAAIEKQAAEILAAGTTVITLGGDHSITLPLLRAHAAKFGPLAVVHFDSHPDTWDYEYPGHPFSHGTPFRRALEEKLIDTQAYVQIGIRGPTSDPRDLEITRNLGARVIDIRQAMTMGTEQIVETIQKTIGNRRVYVSFDIDSVDPAYAPGTGTPEVGGFTSFQALEMVRGLSGLDIVGIDVVEVNPLFDHGDITSLLASNLVFEFLSLLALEKRGTIAR